jgi:hypothetical protein
MSRRFTMGLAGLLLVGAIFVGYRGLILSHQPAPIAETVIQPAAPVAANLYATNCHLFQFTQLALGAASKGLAKHDPVAALRPAIEIIRGNQASQQSL